MDWKFGRHFVTRFVLVLLVFQFFTPVQGLPDSPSRNRLASDPPPAERIIDSMPELDKLSPDLRSLVDGLPPAGGVLASQEAGQQPLIVSAIIQPGTEIRRYFRRSAVSREVAGFQWITGEIDPARLPKLVSVPAVQSVFSIETYQTTEAPGLDELRAGYPRPSVADLRAAMAAGGPALLAQQLQRAAPAEALDRQPYAADAPLAQSSAPQEAPPGVLKVHDVTRVHEQSVDGENVVVAVVDTGVDFAHPDLAGTQAIVKGGPYDGWPFAYDVVSGALYAMDGDHVLTPANYWRMVGWTQFVRTSLVHSPACAGEVCSASLLLSSEEQGIYQQFTWPNTSKSGVYYYTVHPDINLLYASFFLGIGYQGAYFVPPVVIVSDTLQPGVYDTVYVDVDYDSVLSPEGERLDRGKLQGGADLSGDEVWDLSAGMLAWIANGEDHPPGVATLYPEVMGTPPPAAGRLLVFNTDLHGHGTNVASSIAGQGRMTDPAGRGPSNPLFAGGSAAGGVGGPVIRSVAPGARIAAFQNGFYLPLDAWTLAVFGFDGTPGSGDEAHIVSNSWGDSRMIEDGWDTVSRFAQKLQYTSPSTPSFLVATGNGGHGYGTTTSPGGGSIIDVGASTASGTLKGFEFVSRDQFLSGEVQPWSNRGPGGLGDVSPDVVAVGAWAPGANPLNIYYGDGQSAYDIFGGTSLATPVAAGSMALVYQAFRQVYDRWPDWDEARSLLLNGAQDLGYDVLVQGAGNVQAGRSIDIIAGGRPWFWPEQWLAGRYGPQQVQYPAFPSILFPGEQDEESFTVHNPTSEPIEAKVSSRTWMVAHEETFTFPYVNPPSNNKLLLPIFLEDLTRLIETHQPDMVRAQLMQPFGSFDIDRNRFPESWWTIALYDWQDLNGNGYLWKDANFNDQVEEKEIDIAAGSGLFEFNRFSAANPVSNYMETSLGSQGLSQRHDGVFLGLRCYFCLYSTTLQVRVTFYKQVEWDWISFTGQSMTVQPGTSDRFEAALAVPPNTPIGLYQGALALELDGSSQAIPVLVHVAAGSPTFQLGSAGRVQSPYENTRLVGGFNWNWRYEAGDWRFFFFDPPAEMALKGKSLVVDTRWSGPETDVDTWIFGADAASSSLVEEEFFGPQGMRQLGGSDDAYLSSGKFGFKTSTGYSREVVSADLADGLGMIVLHNVSNDGSQFAEGITGSIFTLESLPQQVVLKAQPQNPQTPYLATAQTVSLLSTSSLPDGVTIRAYGMSAPVSLQKEWARQDTSYNYCSASWVYRADQGGLKIDHAGLLEISTASAAENLDIDLYLFRDNGDGVWNCSKDKLVTYSIRADSAEKIKIYFPMDGRYWIAAHGYSVPGGSLPFSIDVRAVQGAGLSLRNLPIGGVAADEPVSFTVRVNAPYTLHEPAALEGLLMIGIPDAPTLLEVPVSIRPSVLLYPSPVLTLNPAWTTGSPRTLALTFQNQGVDTETVLAKMHIPEAMIFLGCPDDQAGISLVFDPSTRMVAWEGPVAGGEKVTLSCLLDEDSRAGQAAVEITAQVNGLTSSQQWDISLPAKVNTYGVYLPFLRR